MRINKLNNIFQVYNKNQNVKKVKPDKTNKLEDEVKISEQAVEFQFAMQKLRNVEDIRREKVEKIKTKIETGTYEVDGHKIAEKILDDIGFDKKI